MSERIPTDVLVEQARGHVARYKGTPLEDYFADDLLTALADRLAELAALEPVGELLAVMEPGALLTLLRMEDRWSAGFDANIKSDRGLTAAKEADTPEAALAALAEQVRG